MTAIRLIHIIFIIYQWYHYFQLELLFQPTVSCESLPFSWREMMSVTQFPIRPGRKVSLKCNPGHSLTGDNTVTCKEGTEFSFIHSPSCVRGTNLENLSFFTLINLRAPAWANKAFSSTSKPLLTKFGGNSNQWTFDHMLSLKIFCLLILPWLKCMFTYRWVQQIARNKEPRNDCRVSSTL